MKTKKNNLEESLIRGMKEALAIAKGEAKPASTVAIEPSPKQIRQKLCLSQREFAAFVGVNTYTLRNWEQRRRKIPTVARTLFRIADAHPEVVLELHRKSRATA